VLTLFVVPVVYLLFARRGRVAQVPTAEPAAVV
jgi:hypothetical protein